MSAERSGVQCSQTVPVQGSPGVLLGVGLAGGAVVRDGDVPGIVGRDLLVAAMPANRCTASGAGQFGVDAACALIKFSCRLHGDLLSRLQPFRVSLCMSANSVPR